MRRRADEVFLRNRAQRKKSLVNLAGGHLAMSGYTNFRPNKPVLFRNYKFSFRGHERKSWLSHAINFKLGSGEPNVIARHSQHGPQAEAALNDQLVFGVAPECKSHLVSAPDARG